jgi:transglutaminase-like putative cysteine protease
MASRCGVGSTSQRLVNVAWMDEPRRGDCHKKKMLCLTLARCRIWTRRFRTRRHRAKPASTRFRSVRPSFSRSITRHRFSSGSIEGRRRRYSSGQVRPHASSDELRELAPYLERHQLDPIDAVGRWARELLFPSGAIGAFELLTRLSRGIHHGFIYRRREAKGVQLPVETLRLGHGSCRDFAVLMIEAARSIGFAARFASGYLAIPLDDPQEPTGRSGRGSTHAWAQIYLPGAGWIDFDPTSGSVGNVDLVTVAVVPDPRHAIPLHGTYVGFPSDHLGMEVQVSVTFDSPEGDLDRSATDRISAIGPTRSPRQNHRSPVSLHGYPELETGAKRSQPAAVPEISIERVSSTEAQYSPKQLKGESTSNRNCASGVNTQGGIAADRKSA